MALCVRRLRGAPGLGYRWRSGARGAGGAAGRLQDGGRVREVAWHPELSPCPRVTALHRHPVPSSRGSVFQQPQHGGATRLYPLPSRHGKALRQLQEILRQSKRHTTPASQHFPCQPMAGPLGVRPQDKESGHLSSAQQDCFRRLFEPGVCRTPYQALALSSLSTAPGVLAFQLTKPAGKNAVPPGGTQPDMEQHLAVMYAKLREELPSLFLKPPDFSMYRQDVEFVSNALHIHTRSLVLYRLTLTLARIVFLTYFFNSRISILKLTSHPENSSIQARWAVSALPLHMAPFCFFRQNKTELYRTYDAHSTFYLASDGLIRLHKLERVMPSGTLSLPKKTLPALALLALGLGEHRPALNILFFRRTPHKL